jgi:hypothetical protein
MMAQSQGPDSEEELEQEDQRAPERKLKKN